MKYKLSIILPCYNCQNNIGNLLDVIFSQIDSFVEVILIDDGSTDETNNVISSFISSHGTKDFYLYKTENGGAAKARQLGLNYARGEYIFFCDSDDLISEEFVNNVMHCIEINNPDMIYFSSIVTSSNDINKKISDKMYFSSDCLYDNSDDFLFNQIKNSQWTAAVWTYVFKNQLVLSSAGFFTHRTAHEDHLFTIRMLSYAKKINVLKETLYIQILTEGSLTNSKKDFNYLYERCLAYQEVYDDMKNTFSSRTLLAYREWSIDSILRLCRDNKISAIRLIFSKKIYRELLLSKLFFFSYLSSKIKTIVKNKVRIL